MHSKEAIWIAARLAEMTPSDLDPVVNVGSSTEEFRCVNQPHVDRIVFQPLRERGIRVVHQDIKKGRGVDLVGDLEDERFVRRLAGLEFKTVLCTNVLEHVRNPDNVVRGLIQLVKDGGYIIVTVPNAYPKHMDPIDNMFRPTPEDLGKLFGSAEMVKSTVLPIDTVWRSLKSRPRELSRLFARATLPVYRYRGWITALHKVGWMFRPRSVSCVVLRMVSGEPGAATGRVSRLAAVPVERAVRESVADSQ